MFYTVEALKEPGNHIDGKSKQIWAVAVEINAPVSFKAQNNVELQHLGFKLLNEMVLTQIYTSSMQKAAESVYDYWEMKVKNSLDFQFPHQPEKGK